MNQSYHMKNLSLFSSVILFHLISDVFAAAVTCVAGGLFGGKMSGEAAKARANERRTIFSSICLHDSQNLQLRRIQLLPFYFNYMRKPGNTIFCSMIIRKNSNLYHPWKKNFLRQLRSLRQIPRQLRCGHRISEGTPALSSPCHQAFGVRLHHSPRLLLT